MLVEHLPLGQPLGPGGDHVLLSDLFKKGIFGQDGRDGKAAKNHSRDRHRDVPQVIDDARTPAELVPVARREATQREPLQLTAKHHQQHHAENKARNRVADQHQQRRDQIEARTGAHRLGDAKRHRNEIADEKRPQPKADRHRQFLDDQRADIAVLEKAFTQVEARKLPQHLPKAFMRRFVEAVQRLDLFDALRINTLRPPVAQAPAFSPATGCAGLAFGQVLFDRPAGHELHDGKGDEQHAKQRRDHQQDSF